MGKKKLIGRPNRRKSRRRRKKFKKACKRLRYLNPENAPHINEVLDIWRLEGPGLYLDDIMGMMEPALRARVAMSTRP